MTTTQQPSKQGFAMLDRPTHRTTSRVLIVGNHRLFALINVPVNVTFMMIQDQHRPFLATAPHLPYNSFLPRVQPHHRLATAIAVGPALDRVLHPALHRVVPPGLPTNFAP